MFSRRDVGGGVLAAGVAFSLRKSAYAQAKDSAWQKLPTIPFKGKQDDISFISKDIGWYGNGEGKLYHTIDGGMSWVKVLDQPGTFIRALGFIDEKTGFLGNVGTDYYPGVTDKHPLYRTDDSGKSWTAVNAPDISAVAGICGIDILPVHRIFQGEVHTDHLIHAAGRVGGPAAIMKSEDSGKTWTVQDMSKQAGMILDIKFLDAQTGFVCASTNSDMEKAEALILRTADGGKTWNPAYTSGRRLENCWKMSWPSARVGYATVQSYDEAPANTKRVVIKTADGGKTWVEMPLVTAPGIQQFGIGFIDETRGWVGCKAGGYETHDGGQSWSPVAFGRAVNKIRIIKNRVFAIGAEVHRLDV